MNLYHLPFGMGDVIAGLLAIVFYLLPFVLVLLIVKWLYESKKSLERIDRNLEGINAALQAGSQVKGSEHEQH